MICHLCSEHNFPGGTCGTRDRHGRTALMYAASLGHEDCVLGLLEAGCLVNAVTTENQTALMFAVISGKDKCVEILIQAGATVDQRDPSGDTALMLAVNYGREACLRYLVQNGADIDVTNNSGFTPIQKCAAHSNLACLNILIESGAKVDVKNNEGMTALMFAATNPKTSCLCALIHYNASVYSVDNNGNSALSYAVQYKHVESVNVLIQAEAKVNLQNFRGRTPLMLAAENNSGNILRSLLQNGAHADLIDGDGNTALVFAASQVDAECTEMLIESNSLVDRGNNKGTTALMKAAESHSVPCMKALIQGKANVNNVDENNQTALMYAGWGEDDNASTATLLIEAGAKINATDTQGKTALIHAASNSLNAFVGRLISKGALVNVQDVHGKTALMYAVCSVRSYWGEANTLKTLVDNGAHLNSTDQKGKTALMCAASKSKEEAVTFLLQRGAGDNVNATDQCGRTALIHAAISKSLHNYVETMEALISGGADTNAQDIDGMTALMFTVKMKLRNRAPELFFRHKTDPELKDNEGRTVLCHAIIAWDSNPSTFHVCGSSTSLFNILPFVKPVLDERHRFLLERIRHRWRNQFLSSIEKMELIRLMVCNGILENNANVLNQNMEDSSMLIWSLKEGHLDAARYLIAIRYITEVDLKTMKELHSNQQLSDEAMDFVSKALCYPWRLETLALITLSSALGPSPHRRERVSQTGLPVPLQNILMFEEPRISHLSVNEWKDIPLCFD